MHKINGFPVKTNVKSQIISVLKKEAKTPFRDASKLRRLVHLKRCFFYCIPVLVLFLEATSPEPEQHDGDAGAEQQAGYEEEECP